MNEGKPTAAAQLSPQLTGLLDLAFDFARGQVKGSGGLTPTGLALEQDGKISVVDALSGSAQDSIDTITAALRGKAETGLITAAAVVLDIYLRPLDGSEKVDTIQVMLEDARGKALHAFQQYRRTPNGDFRFENIFSNSSSPTIFVSPPKPSRPQRKWWQFWK